MLTLSAVLLSDRPDPVLELLWFICTVLPLEPTGQKYVHTVALDSCAILTWTQFEKNTQTFRFV